jgi:hypothetical protein
MGIQLLTIEELAKEPDFIVLFGQNVEVLNFDDFGIIEQGEMQRMLNRISRFAAGNGTETERKDLENSVNRLIRKLLPKIPQDVFSRLKPGHKAQVIEAFSDALNKYKEAQRKSSAQETETNESETWAEEVAAAG